MSDHRPVSIGRKLPYGFGSVAFGVEKQWFRLLLLDLLQSGDGG